MLHSISTLSPLEIFLSLCGATSVYICYLLIQDFFNPLRDIPGPLLARYTRLWLIHEIFKGKFEQCNIEMHRRYGPIVRIAPNNYSIDDVNAAKIVYGHGSTFLKAPWYLSWQLPDPRKANLFGDIDTLHHAVQRRKYASAYSTTSLVTYEPLINGCTSLLCQRLDELATYGNEFNLSHWLQCYAFDVIGAITFGKSFGLLDLGEDNSGIFKAIDDRGFYSTFVGLFPPFLHRLIYPHLPTTGGPGYLARYTTEQISGRQQLLKDPQKQEHEGLPDILTKFTIAHEKNPEKMTELDLRLICQSNIAAGSDTTAITLSSIFYHLLKNMATLIRLRAEIDDAAAQGKLSSPVTFGETQNLVYLKAVINESLRMHSAVGLPLQRLVPVEGAELVGRKFPPGSTVGINPWVAHRNISVFGSDAGVWRPERWLEIGDKSSGADFDKYFFAFGKGSRTCIGKNISLIEISKLVPELVRRFDFKLANSLQTREWRSLNRWFVKQLDFEVVVSLRAFGVDGSITS